MKYKNLFLTTLTVALLSACGGTSTHSVSNGEDTPHPEFEREKVTENPHYSPIGHITDSTPTFSWRAIAGATSYNFGHESVESGADWHEYTVTSAEAGCLNVGDTCNYTPNNYTLPNNEEKAWWIRGLKSGKWQPWSQPTVFALKNGNDTAPEPPIPLTPSGVVNTALPVFTWKAIDGATNYKLGYEDTNQNWQWFIISAANANCQNGLECTYTVSDPHFTSGQVFAWWLKSEKNGNWSDWSDPAIFSFGQVQTGKPFQFKVKGSFLIKANPSYNYVYSVDCNNDGIHEGVNITGNFNCDASASEEKTISISGLFPHFVGGFRVGGGLTEVTQWGDQKWRSMEQSFISLKKGITATDIPDLSQVTSMRKMFFHAPLINNSNLSLWDVSHVTDMSEMFVKSPANPDISNWDVSNVTNMQAMFQNNAGFNQDIGNWKVSNVTDMSHMFQSATAFNQNLNTWDVSNVTNMRQMFHGATSFNQPLSNWNTGKVINMGAMLASTKFNQPLNSWDVSHVEDFLSMFQLTPFNQDISNWDVSHATRMSFMFQQSRFNQDISTWDVSNVTTMDSMFDYNPFFYVNNYSRLLIQWSRLNLQHNVKFGATHSKYSGADADNARKRLKNDFGWSITDAGQL